MCVAQVAEEGGGMDGGVPGRGRGVEELRERQRGTWLATSGVPGAAESHSEATMMSDRNSDTTVSSACSMLRPRSALAGSAASAVVAAPVTVKRPMPPAAVAPLPGRGLGSFGALALCLRTWTRWGPNGGNITTAARMGGVLPHPAVLPHCLGVLHSSCTHLPVTLARVLGLRDFFVTSSRKSRSTSVPSSSPSE
jgi:hypothetical protein